jgi:hypothetical protein
VSATLLDYPMASERSKKAAEPQRSNRKMRTKTAQLPEDVVFWANLVATYEDTSIPALLGPPLRQILRDALLSHGVDPDDAWKSYLRKAMDTGD